MDDAARLQHVLDVLTKLAAGVFAARVELGDQDDELTALALAVNMVAEELAASTEELEETVLARTRELQLAQERLSYEATHDHLTGLANRRMLHQRLDHLLVRRTKDAALVLLDLDGFKDINDDRGHGVGDAVLLQVAARLQQRLQDADTIGRLGGDEFAVVHVGVGADADLEELGQHVLDVFAEPVVVEGGAVHVRASAGIARLDAAASTEELLRLADLAMYRAKDGGKGRVRLYSTDLGEQRHRRLRIEQVLRNARDQAPLPILYQPLVDARTRQIVSAEVMVRWPHVPGALCSPREFIPVAEETGLIVELGAAVLRDACSAAVRWADHHRAPLRLHVNVSGRQLMEQGFAEQVLVTLASAGATPEMLGIEVTESVLLEHPCAAHPLQQLRAAGVQVSIDGFGTGYSPLAALRRLPVDAVKIDRSFVAGIGIDDDDETVVRAVVGLAAGLGLAVVAEGVETERQLDELVRLGCPVVQGYLFARPMPFSDLLDWRAPTVEQIGR